MDKLQIFVILREAALGGGRWEGGGGGGGGGARVHSDCGFVIQVLLRRKKTTKKQ